MVVSALICKMWSGLVVPLLKVLSLLSLDPLNGKIDQQSNQTDPNDAIRS